MLFSFQIKFLFSLRQRTDEPLAQKADPPYLDKIMWRREEAKNERQGSPEKSGKNDEMA
jgi:hypothetical protein